MFNLTWTDFKAVAITTKALKIQYADADVRYYLTAVDGFTPLYQCEIPKSDPAGSDQEDFEDNYKDDANERIGPWFLDDRMKVDANLTFVDASLATMEHWLRKTYDGFVYSVSDYFAKSKNQYRYVLLRCPVGYNGYVRWQVAAELGMEVELYENPTINANGTAHTPYNLNRTSSNTSEIDVYYDSTIGAEGTRIVAQILPGSNQSAAAGTNQLTVVLKENEDYLFKFISRGNGNDMGYDISWFEEATT